jgi:hypothetical protein
MVRAPFIAKYLWHNSGLGKTKDMAALLDIPPRFHVRTPEHVSILG